MIISHEHKKYQERWERLSYSRYNGAYYYSQEIVKNIIPNVQTDRNWITVNLPGIGCDHSIVFIHNNLHPHNYDWLAKYDDVILVCGVPETCKQVSHIGKTIYLPLSIDVDSVQKYRQDEHNGAAFAGRPAKRHMVGVNIPKNAKIIEGLPREKFLQTMATFETIYAVGRTAIEARCLGCEIGVYDSRYPDPSIWQVLDNMDAARILQSELDKIDGSSIDMTWTKAELIKYCEERGIEVKQKDTKAQILDKINA